MVVWRRRFGRIRISEEILVPLGSDPIESLRGLREASPHPFVHIAVPDALLSCEVVLVPDFDEPEDRDAWAFSEASRRRPQDRAEDRVVATARVFEVPDQAEQDVPEGPSVLGYGATSGSPAYTDDVARHRAVLCVMDRVRIEDTLRLLNEAGFVVERIASGLVEATSLSLLSTLQSSEHQTYDPETSAAYALPRVERLSPNALVVTGAFGVAGLDVALGRPRAVTIHDSALEEDGTDALSKGEPLYTPEQRLSPATRDPRTLVTYPDASHPSSSMAAAVAYEALYPGLALVQVLPEVTQREVQRTRRVEEAKHSTLFIACVLLALLALLTGAELVVGALSDKTVIRLQEQAPALALLDRERAEVARMERDLALAKRSQAEQTQTALYLEALTRAVPEDVTLMEVVINRVNAVTPPAHSEITGGERRLSERASGFPLEKSGGNYRTDSFVIKGEAGSGAMVGIYALNIEQLDFVVDSRVLSVTQLSPRALRRRQQNPDIQLFTFELAGRVASAARTRPTRERSSGSP